MVNITIEGRSLESVYVHKYSYFRSKQKNVKLKKKITPLSEFITVIWYLHSEIKKNSATIATIGEICILTIINYSARTRVLVKNRIGKKESFSQNIFIQKSEVSYKVIAKGIESNIIFTIV